MDPPKPRKEANVPPGTPPIGAAGRSAAALADAVGGQNHAELLHTELLHRVQKRRRVLAHLHTRPAAGGASAFAPARPLDLKTLSGVKRAAGSVYNRYGAYIARKAREIGVSPALAAATIMNETGGRASAKGAGGKDSSAGQEKPPIRFEVHQFRKWYLAPVKKRRPEKTAKAEMAAWEQELAAREAALDALWAYDHSHGSRGHKFRRSAAEDWQWVHVQDKEARQSRGRGASYGESQKQEYAALEAARALDERAAMQSFSMGLTQIMGFNAADAGYANAQSMFAAFSTGQEAQLDGFFTFLANHKAGRCLKALQDKDYVTYSHLYNGAAPGTADNASYAKAMEAHADAYGAVTRGLPAPDVPPLAQEKQPVTAPEPWSSLAMSLVQQHAHAPQGAAKVPFTGLWEEFQAWLHRNDQAPLAAPVRAVDARITAPPHTGRSAAGTSGHGIVGLDSSHYGTALGVASGPTGTGPQLAALVLANPNIRLAGIHVSRVRDEADAASELQEVASGHEARRSHYGHAPGGGVDLAPQMLSGMLGLARDFSFSISEVAGASHSPHSRHYAGIAFDVSVINGQPVNAKNPHLRAFMARARRLGATELLGPGAPGHDTHVHAGWPRTASPEMGRPAKTARRAGAAAPRPADFAARIHARHQGDAAIPSLPGVTAGVIPPLAVAPHHAPATPHHAHLGGRHLGGRQTGSGLLTRQSQFRGVAAAAARAGDAHPNVTAAQWALESGWGKKPSGSHNLFGQKAKDSEPGSLHATHEKAGRTLVPTTGRFRDYASDVEGLADHQRRWNSKEYTSAKTDAQAVAALQRHHHATDPEYSTKLLPIIRQYGGTGVGSSGPSTPVRLTQGAARADSKFKTAGPPAIPAPRPTLMTLGAPGRPGLAVQRSGQGDHPDTDPAGLRADLRRQGGTGFAPDSNLRSQLGGHLNFDPGGARLHTGPASAKAARSLNAEAFTIGHDVFFGEGKFDPKSSRGLGLIAHELTHVGQQTGTTGDKTRFFTGRGGDDMEQEAQRTGAHVLANAGRSQGVSVASYARRYEPEGEDDLTALDRQRLDMISLMALKEAENLLWQRGVKGRKELGDLEVGVSLDLARMSNQEAARVWADALADAIAAQVEERDGVAAPKQMARPAVQRLTLFPKLTEREKIRKAIDKWTDVGLVDDINDFTQASEDERMDLALIVANNTWVFGLRGKLLKKIWGSFGGDLPAVVNRHFPPWEGDAENFPGLKDLPQVTRAGADFKADIMATAKDNLGKNKAYITGERERLGLDDKPGAKKITPEEQTAAFASMQRMAVDVYKIRQSQKKMLATNVGFKYVHNFGSGVQDVKFNPFRPLQPGEYAYTEPQRPTWGGLKTAWDVGAGEIAEKAGRYPWLFALLKDDAGEQQMAKIKGMKPDQMSGTMKELFQKLLDQVQAVEDKKDTDWYDLVPVREQFLKGKPAPGGRKWDDASGMGSFANWAAKTALGEREDKEYWKEIGLKTVEGVALVAVTLATAGAAPLFVGIVGGAVAVGTPAVQAYMDHQKAAELTDLNRATFLPDTDLVAQAQIDAKHAEEVAHIVETILAAAMLGPLGKTVLLEAKLARLGALPLAEQQAVITQVVKEIGALRTARIANKTFAEIIAIAGEDSEAGRLVQGARQALLKKPFETLTKEELRLLGIVKPVGVPQGITEAEFAKMSQTVRQGASQFGNDIRAHGSRAMGTAKAESDLDIAIRVEQERFDQIVKERFGKPNPGSAKEKTMLHAIKTGKIQAGEAGLRGVRQAAARDIGKDVDISVVRIGGEFDNGPWLPLK